MTSVATNREEALRRYVSGKLEGDDLESFETALFEDPTLLAEVEEERALRIGAALLKKSDAHTGPLLAPRSRFHWWPIAAAFALGVISSGLVFFASHSRPQDAVVGNVPVLLLEDLRSAAPVRRVFRIPEKSTSLLLQIPISTEGSSRFALSIQSASGAEPLLVRDLRADNDGIITALVPGSSVVPGDYTARLQRTDVPDGNEMSIGFRIER